VREDELARKVLGLGMARNAPQNLGRVRAVHRVQRGLDAEQILCLLCLG
jgi:hypothetical protein